MTVNELAMKEAEMYGKARRLEKINAELMTACEAMIAHQAAIMETEPAQVHVEGFSTAWMQMQDLIAKAKPAKRCEHCGYTEEDKAIQGDHRLCDERQRAIAMDCTDIDRMASHVALNTAVEKAIAEDAAARTPDADLDPSELEDQPEEVAKNRLREAMEGGDEYLIDLPQADSGDAMHFVHTAPTLAHAVAWIREHVGYCDDEGNMNLITVMRKEAE